MPSENPRKGTADRSMPHSFEKHVAGVCGTLLLVAGGCTSDPRGGSTEQNGTGPGGLHASALTVQNGFPGPSDTGVPAGAVLTAYDGPMTITVPGTVIDARIIRGTLHVDAPGVTVTRSMIAGNIDLDEPTSTLVLEDVEVDGAPTWQPAIGFNNITMRRVEVEGARVSVLCGSNCTIEDSWLHGQYLEPGTDWHVNGYLSNGGSNVLLRHNTLVCDAPENSAEGSCTGPAASFGDFEPLRNITYERNLFAAGPGAYCLYAGYNPDKPFGSDPMGIVVTNNIFERGPNGQCASYGPVASFQAGPGNVWAGNRWDDGGEVSPG
ncbi:hypothetical protein ACFYVR_13220 [Rhodococcus sp. NPDC003318]|uniref:hypothetical protein n=1 Tax=Rhodococcus sp. NPDC003318 TaxID=3364503 RepID=UPI0036CE56C2